jgi:hypothetical protein
VKTKVGQLCTNFLQAALAKPADSQAAGLPEHDEITDGVSSAAFEQLHDTLRKGQSSDRSMSNIASHMAALA